MGAPAITRLYALPVVCAGVFFVAVAMTHVGITPAIWAALIVTTITLLVYIERAVR